MRPNRKRWLYFIGLLASGSLLAFFLFPRHQLWTALESPGTFASVEIQHPLPGAVMPRNMPAPVVTWNTNVPGVDWWGVGFKTSRQKWSFEGIHPMWRPSEHDWAKIKDAGEPVDLILAGFGKGSSKVQARSSIRFTVCKETVDNPLFYREVNLPFAEARKDPSHIRWRFGSVVQPNPPPLVLQKLPVCANCHSFDQKGEHLAMDVDYANNKGSYIITRTAPEMRLATSDIITWDDFRREDGEQTFGLLAQISPNGRYVLSTVKDLSIFIPRPNLAFSQLFFPVKGILAVYDRETKQFYSLPGADDPNYVQSNPIWSPDGQGILFARTPAVKMSKSRRGYNFFLSTEECEELLKQRPDWIFDIYRIPFNRGKGGKAEPLRGASANGRSNFFPKFSPDGKWIVFCQTTNYMLLRPDSRLYVMPAEGGEPRKLACNLDRMNSWHSWSPDGRWLVFSSKAHSDYTQLYLTRMSEQGEASPPVWLAHLVEPGWAANIPEFVNLAPNAIAKINENFLDDYSYFRAGSMFFDNGELGKAIEQYQKALALNPNNSMAHHRLGFLLQKAQPQLAFEHLQTAVRLDDQNPLAQYDLGIALATRNDFSNAVVHIALAVQMMPEGFGRQYAPATMHYVLADAYYRLGLYAESVPSLEIVLRQAPEHADANYLMAIAKVRLGETESSKPFYQKAIRGDPMLAQLPDYPDFLSQNYISKNQFHEALPLAEHALQLAQKIGRTQQAARLQERIALCRAALGPKQ